MEIVRQTDSGVYVVGENGIASATLVGIMQSVSSVESFKPSDNFKAFNNGPSGKYIIAGHNDGDPVLLAMPFMLQSNDAAHFIHQTLLGSREAIEKFYGEDPLKGMYERFGILAPSLRLFKLKKDGSKFPLEDFLLMYARVVIEDYGKFRGVFLALRCAHESRDINMGDTLKA